MADSVLVWHDHFFHTFDGKHSKATARFYQFLPLKFCVSVALLMEAIRRQLFDFVIIISSVCPLKFSFCICKKTPCQRLLKFSGGQPLCLSNKYMRRFEILCINPLSLHQYLFKFLVNHWDKFPLGCIFMIFHISESFPDNVDEPHNWLNSVLKLKNITLVKKWNTDVWV